MAILSSKGSAKKSSIAGAVALIIALILAGGLVLGVANLAVITTTIHRTGDLRPLRQLVDVCPLCFLYFAVTPAILASLVSFVVLRHTTPTATMIESNPEPASRPSPPSSAPALRLLALLQQEGRFLDFVQEEIGGYSDAQIGAAVRAIHAGCRRVVAEHIELRRVLPAEEGSEVTIEEGFDAASIRLSGNVTSTPPFRGTVQHGGWRVTKCSLPSSSVDTDASVVARAEVEIR
jgi:hypothetical protein